MALPRTHVRAPVEAASLAISSPHHSAIRGAHWVLPRLSTAPELGVCEWSPEGLHDKTVSWIPNADEILELANKK